MLEPEVDRLRRLRGAALRLRTLSRELRAHKSALYDPLLHKGACAAWRVARTVSGRLRAHPFANYQKDADFLTLLRNGLSAKLVAHATSSRGQALQAFDRQLKLVVRRLQDARALAWDGGLSESLGRSQIELQALAVATEAAWVAACQEDVQSSSARLPGTGAAGNVVRLNQGEQRAADWPFVAF